MHRRRLLRSAPVVAALPLAGCLGAESEPDDEPGDYPDEWRHVDPFDTDIVEFEDGAFDTSAGDPPEEGASLDGREAWRLLTETAWALREASFQLAFESSIVEGDHAGTWRWTLWRNADADAEGVDMGAGVVYQRTEMTLEDEPDGIVRMYNDGTRYVATTEGDETEYYHVPDPHWHSDRVDAQVLMSLLQLLEFEGGETVVVDGTELRRVRHVGAVPDGFEVADAGFFIGLDGIVRNVRADYGSDPQQTRAEFATDGAVEITAGTPTIAAPAWIDEAEAETRDPIESPP